MSDLFRKSSLEKLSSPEQLKASLEKQNVTAFHDGVVQEVIVERGDVIAAGASVIKHKMGRADNKGGLCYMPLSEGKRVAKGMKVMI